MCSLCNEVSCAYVKPVLTLEWCSGQEVEVDLEKDVLTDIASGKQYPLKSIGEVNTTRGCSYSLQTAGAVSVVG